MNDKVASQPISCSSSYKRTRSEIDPTALQRKDNEVRNEFRYLCDKKRLTRATFIAHAKSMFKLISCTVQ